MDDVVKFYVGFSVNGGNVFLKRHPDGRLNGEVRGLDSRPKGYYGSVEVYLGLRDGLQGCKAVLLEGVVPCVAVRGTQGGPPMRLPRPAGRNSCI